MIVIRLGSKIVVCRIDFLGLGLVTDESELPGPWEIGDPEIPDRRLARRE